MHGALFDFVEGRMTISEFRQRFCPCIPKATVHYHLQHGRNSARAMLEYVQPRHHCGKKGRAASPFRKRP